MNLARLLWLPCLWFASVVCVAAELPDAEYRRRAYSESAKLEQRDELLSQALAARADNNLKEALDKLNQAWQIETQVLEPIGDRWSPTLEWLTLCECESRQSATAHKRLAELAPLLQPLEENRWVRARHEHMVGRVAEIQKFNEQQLNQLEQISRLSAQATQQSFADQLNRAIETQQQAIESVEKLWSNNSLEYARSLARLATFQRQANNHTSAQESCDKAIKILQAAVTQPHFAVAMAYHERAAIAIAAQQPTEAKQYTSQAANQLERCIGKTGRYYEVLERQQWIALSLQDIPGLEALCTDEVELRRQAGETKSLRLAKLLKELSLYNQIANRLKESEQSALQAVEMAPQVSDPQSLLIASTLMRLGDMYSATHRHDQALEAFSKAAAIYDKDPQAPEFEVMNTLAGMANVHFLKGQWRELESTSKKCLPLVEKMVDRQNALYLEVAIGLGEAQTYLGKYAEAVKVLSPVNQTLEMPAVIANTPAALRLRAHGRMAIALWELKESEAAEKMMDRALKACEEIDGKKGANYSAWSGIRGSWAVSSRKFEEAVKWFSAAADAQKAARGNEDPWRAFNTTRLAGAYRELGELDKAIALAKEAAETLALRAGKGHFLTASARTELHLCFTTAQRYSEAEALGIMSWNDLSEAKDRQLVDDRLHVASNLCSAYLGQSKYLEARTFLGEAIAWARTQGKVAQPKLLEFLQTLAMVEKALGNYPAAEKALTEAAGLIAKSSGTDGPDYVKVQIELANNLVKRGQLTDAQTLLDSLAVTIGKLNNPDLTSEYHQTRAELFSQQGDLARCDAAMLEALRALEVYDDTNVRVRAVLSIAFQYFHSHGQWDRAEQVLARLEAVGKKLPDTFATEKIDILNSRAKLHQSRGRLSDAVAMTEQANELVKKSFGADSLQYAAQLQKLGYLRLASGDKAKAAEDYGAAVRAYRASGHTRFVPGLLVTQSICVYESDLSAASKLIEEAVTLYKEQSRSWESEYIVALQMRAFYRMTKENAANESYQREIVEATLTNVELVTTGTSQRQQLEAQDRARGALDCYLSWTRPEPAQAFAVVLRSKGRVLERRRQLISASRNPQLSSKIAELQSIVSKISSQVSETLSEAERVKLLEQRYELEAQLFRTSRTDANTNNRNQVLQLQRALPSDGLLIDFYEYDRTDLEEIGKQKLKADQIESKRHLVAFVIEPKGEVKKIELGEVLPISQALAQWAPSIPRAENEQRIRASLSLRKLIWEPLASVWTSEPKQVIISADGITNRIPWMALPGKQSKQRLGDDLLIRQVPSALSILNRTEQLEETKSTQLSFVAIGDVDYGSASQGSKESDKWQPLHGTKQEIDAISSKIPANFQRLQLTGVEATEEKLRSLVPRASLLHIATHAAWFGATPDYTKGRKTQEFMAFLAMAVQMNEVRTPLSQRLSSYGTTSGIALANANRSTQLSNPSDNDGWLTADEVSSLFMPGTEMVVLSACETAAGEEVPGEGLQGLQRAFHTAGAHATVSTLWKIPDSATAALMERFYDNIWNKKLTRPEALRQAQLWFRNQVVNDANLQRGLTLNKLPPITDTQTLPPFYWAAFVYCGE